MIRVKLKRTIYTEYEPKPKCGGNKSERGTNKRAVHFSKVVPIKSFSKDIVKDRTNNCGINSKSFQTATVDACKEGNTF